MLFGYTMQLIFLEILFAIQPEKEIFLSTMIRGLQLIAYAPRGRRGQFSNTFQLCKKGGMGGGRGGRGGRGPEKHVVRWH